MNRREFLAAGCCVSVTGAAGCLGSDGGDPESTVESYFEAVDDNDADAVDELVHDEAPTSHSEEDLASIGGVRIIEIEQRPIEDIVEELDHYDDPDAIVEFEEHERDRLDEEHGFSEFAYVYFQVMPGDGPVEEEYFPVVRDGGEWYIWT